MDDNQDELGRAIDKLDNLAHALALPLAPQTHVAMLKEALPEVVRDLKAAFVKVVKNNPWE